jgi:hypothetical protein
MDLFTTILVGIFYGIITAVCIFIFKQMHIKTIMPWYIRTTYRGIDLSGNWSGMSKVGNPLFSKEYRVTMQLVQVASEVSGNYQVFYAERRVVNMSCVGEVKDDYILLRCASVDPRNLSFGSMLLKIKNCNGCAELNGEEIFRNLENKKCDVVNASISFREHN